MHKVNAGYTLLVPLKPDRVAAASALLAELDADQERLPFASSATTHFATVTVIPAQPYRDDMLPATLLFATSFCGPPRVHVRELVRIMGDGLREILEHCEGFDPSCSNDELEDFFRDHRHSDTFYSGMRDLSPEDVRRHRQLRDAIEAFIDERQANGGLSGTALAVREEIQNHVKSRADLAWAQEAFKPTLWAWLVFYWRSLVLETVVVGVLLSMVAWLFVDSVALDVIAGCGVAFLVFLGVLILSIREAEREQTYVSERQPDPHVRAVAATQARPVINEFTLAGPIKEEGILRPIFLQLSLWIIGRVADGIPGVPSYATGIDIPTVATARWIATDGGRRLMFISNYTNDAVPYVRDFIETRGGAMRINLSFGFGRGYPKTRWIVLDGALTDPNAYIHALVDHQTPTLFWYGPYRDISIDNIKRNRDIREGLFAPMTEDKARDWLHLL